MRTFIFSILISLGVVFAVTTMVRAQAADDAAARTSAQLDAGAAGVDVGPYRAPGAITGAAPVVPLRAITHPDPIDDPQAALEAVRAARRLGLWVAIALVFVIVAGAVNKRLQPDPEAPPPDPHSWRARSIAITGAVIAVGGPLVALAAGGGWGPVITGLAFAAGAIRHAINPQRGSKAASSAAPP